MNTIKRLFIRRICLSIFASAATIFIAQASVAQGFGSLGNVFEKAESEIRSQVKSDPAQMPTTPQGNQSLPTDEQREAKKVTPTQENNTEVAASQNSPNAPPPPPKNDKASTLDNLMGSDQTKPSNVTSSITKASFFADFESDYLATSDDNGNIAPQYLKVAEQLALILPNEYGVQPSCVQEIKRDGAITWTSQGVSVATALYDILDKFSRAGSNGNQLRERMESLSKPASGCPRDFASIKLFLEEYADFAKGMVERKRMLVVERKAKKQEQANLAKETKEAQKLAFAVEQQEREQAKNVRIVADYQANERAKEEREAQSREAKAREAEMLRQKKEADTNRAKKLLSGIEKPVSFGDYMLMYPSEYGTFLFTHPKLNADNKMYLLRGSKLDREESDGLVVKSSDNSYIMVKRTRSTTIFGDLQINWPIAVIGKYVGNTQYTTVIGAVKTAAVIEAIVIAKEPVQY